MLKASILGAVRDQSTAAIVQVTANDQRDLLLALNDKFDAIGQPGALLKDAGNGMAPLGHFDDTVMYGWRAELKRTSQDLLAWPTTLASKEWIPRSEYDQILSIIGARTSAQRRSSDNQAPGSRR